MATQLSPKEKQLNIQIGAQLRQQRQLLGLTQEYVGKCLGISYQQIQKYEKGANAITAARLQSLCAVLEINIAQLLKAPAPNPEEQRLSRSYRHMNAKEQTYILAIADIFRKAVS